MKKLSQNEFINRSIEIHGNYYDYSLVNYKNLTDKVSIICPKHGIYEVSPRVHLISKCKLCVNNNIKLDSDIFIKRSLKIHGNKYDYSLINYVNLRIKIKIICKKHGIFEQTPNSHLSGSGCPKCANNYSSKENFLKKTKKIHGNRYDYSLVKYINAKTKIKIICRKHGVFKQTPNSHLNGAGCSICNRNQLTFEIFKDKSIKIHGNKYDYSLVKYKNINTPVNIICPIHGEFKQLPSTHLYGNECPTCKFIKKSNKKHNNRYDYSLINYVNNKHKIKIICPIHGEFKQIPNNHLSGNGCPKCVGLNKTNDEFIIECKTIHGNKYDYTLSIYDNVSNKINIICKKHGIFKQTPDNHLRGKGCPICTESKGEMIIRRLLENNNISFIIQKKFDSCKDKRKLPFDFYLPKYNCCVEYDGIQHFKPVEIWGGHKNLEYNKKHDEIKTTYCKKNNIKLIRIKNINNIEKILKKELLF